MRRIISVALAIILSLMIAIPVCASSVIKSVTVAFSVDKSLEAGECRFAEPTTGSSDYEIYEYTWSKDPSEWTAGSKVTCDVTIVPRNGKSFSRSDTTVKISGKNGEVASKKISSQKIGLKLNYWPTMQFANPTNLYWEEDGVLVWDKVPGCSKYEVKVNITDYDTEKTSSKTISVTKNKADLSEYVTNGTVSCSVRAVAKNDSQTKWVTASDWVNSDDPAEPSSDNTTFGSFNGSGPSLTFKDGSGNKASGWQKINGSWYYFNPANGNKAVTDKWAQIDGRWYYFSSNGAMYLGWLKSGNNWFFLNPDAENKNFLEGQMVTGWTSRGPTGPWYFLNDGSAAGYPLGAMLHDTVTPDGHTVDSNGECSVF